jgi:serine/threonine protein kinase
MANHRAMERPLEVGERVGEYTIVAVVEPGSYLAVHRDHARRVVIETGRPAELRNPVASIAGHPGIARIWDHGVLGEINGRVWRAVELADGIALYDVLGRRRLAAFEVAVLLRDIADVLAHAHRLGAVHGALTIRTVVLATEPTAEAAVSIRGWGGGSRRSDADNAFVAPEGGGDAPVDVYALGSIAYRAYTGVFPPDLLVDPPGVGDVGVLVLRMLASAPDARPTAAEVRATAGRLADELARTNDDRVGVLPGPRFARPKWTPPPPNEAVSDVAATTPLGSADRSQRS